MEGPVKLAKKIRDAMPFRIYSHDMPIFIKKTGKAPEGALFFFVRAFNKIKKMCNAHFILAV